MGNHPVGKELLLGSVLEAGNIGGGNSMSVRWGNFKCLMNSGFSDLKRSVVA